MGETHHQVRCPACGLFAVWVPRNLAWQPPAAPEASCLGCGYLRTLAVFRDGTDAGLCQECIEAIRGAR